jgi:hypothetical protein
MSLERCPFSLVSPIKGLLGRNSSGSCLENREYRRRWYGTLNTRPLYKQKLALTSPSSGGRSVGIVCSRAQAMESSFTDSTRGTGIPSHNVHCFRYMEALEDTLTLPLCGLLLILLSAMCFVAFSAITVKCSHKRYYQEGRNCLCHLIWPRSLFYESQMIAQ